MIELYDGLVARSQNRWPSLEFDIGALNSLASAMFVAGFYYKTFMWPKSFWEKIYEPMIRRAAGLGDASKEADPDKYEKAYAHCDLLVIGSGPAGLMAALTAARPARASSSPMRVQRSAARCSTRMKRSAAVRPCDGRSGTIAELSSMPNVTLMPRTTIFGWYDDNIFGAVERVNDHVLEPSPLRAAAALLADHGQARGDGDRRRGAADRVRRQ